MKKILVNLLICYILVRLKIKSLNSIVKKKALAFQQELQ